MTDTTDPTDCQIVQGCIGAKGHGGRCVTRIERLTDELADARYELAAARRTEADDVHRVLPKDHQDDCATEADLAEPVDLMKNLRRSIDEAKARRLAQPETPEQT